MGKQRQRVKNKRQGAKAEEKGKVSCAEGLDHDCGESHWESCALWAARSCNKSPPSLSQHWGLQP